MDYSPNRSARKKDKDRVNEIHYESTGVLVDGANAARLFYRPASMEFGDASVSG